MVFSFTDTATTQISALCLHDAPAISNQAVLMSSLFSVTDADNDAITQYRFWDDTPGGGFFKVNGVAQPWSGSSLIISAADLAIVSYVGGATNATETLWVRASDGIELGAFKTFTMATVASVAPVNHAPVVSATNFF